MNTSKLVRALSAVALLAVSVPNCLNAQGGKSSLVIASVTDAKTGKPLENAEVTLPDANVTARTDWAGEARLPNVSRGAHKFEVRHPGYAALDIELMVDGDSTGPVFRMASAAAPAAPATPALEPVNIAGRAASGTLSEFEARRAQGGGKYLTADELTANANRTLTMVAVRAFGLMSGPDSSRPGREVLLTRRSRPRLNSTDAHCGIDVYLDGSQFLDDIDSLHPSDLGGVEYYPIERAPGAYRKLTDNCGVLLLWSRK
jgi:hypothetical protein